MVREFLRWWLDQLCASLPAGWVRRWRIPDGIIVAPTRRLAESPDLVAVSSRRAGHEVVVGQFQADAISLPSALRSAGGSVLIRLSADDVLAKTFVLPLAAERHLDQVLAFEMDRETPFTATEVYWTSHVLRREQTAGQLWVRVLILPHSALAPLLQMLDRARLRPHLAEIEAGPDRGARISLGNTQGRPARSRALRPALAGCAILALVALTLPYVQQGLSLLGLERSIAAEKQAAVEAQQLQQQIDRLSGGTTFVEQERIKLGRPLVALAALTRLLPADTYLTDLGLHQGKITFTGRSAGASRLIGLLAATNQLRDPAFAAPVTRIGGSELENFTITAEVAP